MRKNLNIQDDLDKEVNKIMLQKNITYTDIVNRALRDYIDNIENSKNIQDLFLKMLEKEMQKTRAKDFIKKT